MIGIVDYSMGNLRSVQKALQHLGHEADYVSEPDRIAEMDRLILPGVGAFGDAMAQLRRSGLDEAVRAFAATGKPFLGVCLGLQLLFESSDEDGPHEGLSLLPGRCVRFQPTDPELKVPHMGWNALALRDGRDGGLFAGLHDGDHVYFVHSYYACPADDAVIAAEADYDGRFCAAVAHENIRATQFHPEKSQAVGLRILQNFATMN